MLKKEVVLAHHNWMTYRVETTLGWDVPIIPQEAIKSARMACPEVGATNRMGKVSQTRGTGAETIGG